MLLGLMTAIVTVGAIVAFERAEAPTIPENQLTPMTFILSSPAFKDGASIPTKYTCDGENISPELRISGVPDGTQSFVLVMDDPDIPDAVKQSRGIEKFDHWALYNIPVETTLVTEGASVGTGALTSLGKEGYVGPCPPDREHRYFFRLYALSGTLNFIKAPTLDEVETAARGMELGRATLMGTYVRDVVTN